MSFFYPDETGKGQFELRKKARKADRMICILLPVVFLIGIPVRGNAEEMYADAESALLVDAETGIVLYEKNAKTVRYPASTTKIMTGLLAVEAVEEGKINLSDRVAATVTAAEGIPSDASHLKEKIQTGEVLSVEDYLYAALLQSDTYSCHMLAECVDGTVERFVEHMNRRAEELGCRNIHFSNPTGYPDLKHYGNAADLILIAEKAMEYPVFAGIVGTADYCIPATEMTEERKIHNSNWLLGMPLPDEQGNCIADRFSGDYFYPYCCGIKTGYTKAAGNCLVSCAEKDGRRLFCVILGAENVKMPDGKIQRKVFTESGRLLEWGFSNFEQKRVLTEGQYVGRMECVTKAGEKEIRFYAGESLDRLLPKEKREYCITYQIVTQKGVKHHPKLLSENPPVLRIYCNGSRIAEQVLTYEPDL